MINTSLGLGLGLANQPATAVSEPPVPEVYYVTLEGGVLGDVYFTYPQGTGIYYDKGTL